MRTLLLVLTGIAFAWYLFAVNEVITADQIRGFLASVRGDPWAPIWVLVWLYSPKEAKGEMRATRSIPELDPDAAWEGGKPVADERTDIIALFADEN